MKTMMYPYDIINLFNPWPSDLINWWPDVLTNDVSAHIKETPFAYMLNVETPGMRKKDLKVNIENQTLHIEGNRKLHPGNILRKRNHYEASFKKSYTLPESADPLQIKAKFKEGLLEITIGKKEEFINYREIPVEGVTKNDTNVVDFTDKKTWFQKTGNKLKQIFRKAA